MAAPPLRRPSTVRTLLGIAVLGLIWTGCSGDQGELTGPPVEPGDILQNLRPAIDIQERHTERLLALPGVVGTGVGLGEDGRPAITVFTTDANVRDVPESLEGVPVRRLVTGMFVAFTDPTQRQPRPVPTGVSTGHPSITAGTIGARVKDAAGNVYALSNNHVYAAQNTASIGDGVIQPGAFDGGQDPADRIGTLHAFEPLNFSANGRNTMDAAIALSSTALLGYSTAADGGYGAPSSTIATAFVGQPVQKYGRTTKLTQGQVSEVNVTVDVCYEVLIFFCVKSAHFVGQIGIAGSGFSAGGDSGSLIITNDGNRNPVGLLFAGSDTYTLASPIGAILNRFDVTIDDGSSSPPPPPPPGTTDIAVTDVTAVASAIQGDDVPVSVTVQNIGDQDVGTSFNVTLDDATDAVTIGTQQVSAGLAAGAMTTLNFSWSTGTASIGDHDLSASHDFADDNAGNDSGGTTVTIESEPAPASGMHMGDLFPYSSSEGSSWTAYVIVRVHDDTHNPVEGATVFGTWQRGSFIVDECTTDYAGECLMLATFLRKNWKSNTFTVTDVAFPGLTYTPSDNHDDDGDSDGTSITIPRP